MSRFKKNILFGIVALASFFLVVSSASAATYYFSNAVNTDPTELGNYWNDDGYSDPATQLPNFAIDEVFIATESTFNGDLILNGSASIGTGATITGDLFFRSTYYGGVQQEDGKIVLSGSEVWDFIVQGDVYDANDE